MLTFYQAKDLVFEFSYEHLNAISLAYKRNLERRESMRWWERRSQKEENENETAKRKLQLYQFKLLSYMIMFRHYLSGTSL